MKDLVKDRGNQLTILSTIAETQLPAVYLAFASGFKSKLNYFLRTIPNIRHLQLPVERTTWNKFIPAVTGCHISNDKEWVLVALPTRYCGPLAIPMFNEAAEIEFMKSSKITSEFTAYDNWDKKSQYWDKKFNRRKIQKRHRKINNRNEWQRKTYCGYMNSNRSFKLVDSTSNYRIWIWII